MQMRQGLEGQYSAVFSRSLNWSREEIQVMCAKIRGEMRDPKLHAYVTL